MLKIKVPTVAQSFAFGNIILKTNVNFVFKLQDLKCM